MFKKAERQKTKLKIAVTGPSGSGKTYSSLILAESLGKKIAVIDTESGSASLYSDRFVFDVLEIKPPYTTEKYKEAIDAAINAGYDSLVIDSLSHAWNGEGGILDRKTQLDSRGGNSFTNWSKFTPEQDKFTSKILNADINIIATMRSKQDYVMGENSKGKSAPQKVGLAPVQREGFEYEFTIVFDIAMNHEAQTSKDRTGLFTDKIFKIDKNTGALINTWLGSAKEVQVDNDKQIVIDLQRDLDDLLELCAPDYSKKVIDYVSKNKNKEALQESIKRVQKHIETVSQGSTGSN